MTDPVILKSIPTSQGGEDLSNLQTTTGGVVGAWTAHQTAVEESGASRRISIEFFAKP